MLELLWIFSLTQICSPRVLSIPLLFMVLDCALINPSFSIIFLEHIIIEVREYTLSGD